MTAKASTLLGNHEICVNKAAHLTFISSKEWYNSASLCKVKGILGTIHEEEMIR